MGKSMVVVSTHALVNEMCDERRFQKSINPVLRQVREGVGAGLFTAFKEEEEWGIAHRVLMPAFGPMSIGNMFDEMHDIASQMALKWARQGPNAPIASTDDFTRLALDTLGLCSMGYRFNSFYSTEMHPFIAAMGDFLSECGSRSRRPPLAGFFFRAREQKFHEDIEIMRSTVREVLETRRSGQGADRKDLLGAMLEGVDKKTGKKISDENIMDNLVTFAVAGHETTSGMLSFAFYELLKHPEAYRAAQAEVDSVVGEGPITVHHLSKLRYIAAVLRETLRLDSPIPIFGVEALEDTLLAGKYEAKKGEPILLLLARMHLDAAVYGADANEFKPERMLDDEFEKRSDEFPNSWKPFGNGARACIGRPFAWQEALLVMAMLLQNFDFVLQDPNYSLAIKQTLTIKPKEFYFRAILRNGLTATSLERRLAGTATSTKTHEDDSASTKSAGAATSTTPLTVLYGSNSGTCEAFAQRIANDAAAHGFHTVKLDCLDSAKGRLPTGQPTVIVTASYEGQPPDNAGHFVAWLEGLKAESDTLKDVEYAVFGCGNKDWVSTFHRIPKLVDSKLEANGATQIATTGLGDASSSQLFNVFELWEDEVLWPSLQKRYSTADKASAPTLSVTVTNPRTSTLRQNVKHCVVTSTRVLTAEDESNIKKHIEIRLPEDMTYTAGDYLAVLPVNPGEAIYRALRRFHLSRDSRLTIEAPKGVATNLPIGEGAVAASEILGSYVELQQLATKKNIASLIDAATDDTTRAELEKLVGDEYDQGIVAKNMSVLDLLETYPDIDLGIGAFLSMLPAMRVRQYSISSSSLAGANTVTLTFSLLDAPSRAFSGRRHRGVATSYLASLHTGDVLHAAIRPSPPAFHLPSNMEDTPIICIGAGSGIAPFRAFAQERALMLAAGRSLAPALIFFGCRGSRKDDLYRDEFDEWERQGAIVVKRVYSREPEDNGATGECKYIQDRLWLDRKEVMELWGRGANMYVCGSRGMADGVADVVVRVKKEWHEDNGKTIDDDKARTWFDKQRNLRYISDVFD
jgi:cytochrome P450/NADPH-cytochrome P450 reductase